MKTLRKVKYTYFGTIFSNFIFYTRKNMFLMNVVNERSLVKTCDTSNGLRICVTLFSHNSCYLILHQTEMTWNALINFLFRHIKKGDSSPMVNFITSLVTFKERLYCVDSFLLWFNPRFACSIIITIIRKLILSINESYNPDN